MSTEPTIGECEQQADSRGAHSDRRQRRSSLRIPERRTGFDRRARHQFTGHFRDNPSSLLIVLITINVLSLFDFAFTWVQLSAGVSVEANPLLRLLFLEQPMVAWLFKTSIVFAVSLAIWHSRRYRAILVVALMAFVTYSALFVYHLWGMKATGLI